MDIVDLSKKAWNKVCNHRQSKAADRQPEPSGYVYEELRDTIRDSVVREFKRIAHKKKDTSDCTLVIYIPDKQMYDCCQEALSGYIRDYLFLMTCHEVKDCRIVCSEPSPTDVCTPLVHGLSMALHMPTSKQVPVSDSCPHLEIRVMEGNGTLQNGPVVLAPVDGSIYNIGAGKMACINRRIVRRNDVVIDDNPASPMYALNKFVSRAHAHITYTQEEGYMLYADKRGTSDAGKGLTLSRNSQSIEVTLYCPQSLKDGDSIILSGKVILSVQLKQQ